MSYYNIIPVEVMEDNALPDGAKLLYGVIAGLASRSGECYASRESLGNRLNKGVRTITDYTNILSEQGHIKIDPDPLKKVGRVIKLTSQGVRELAGDNEGVCRESQRGSAEICTHSIKDNTKAIEDTLSFGEFWIAVPWTNKGSKPEARRYFDKLSDQDRLLALESLNAYFDFCTRQKQKTRHVYRYLKLETWEEKDQWGASNKPVYAGNAVTYDALMATFGYIPPDWDNTEIGWRKRA